MLQLCGRRSCSALFAPAACCAGSALTATGQRCLASERGRLPQYASNKADQSLACNVFDGRRYHAAERWQGRGSRKRTRPGRSSVSRSTTPIAETSNADVMFKRHRVRGADIEGAISTYQSALAMKSPDLSELASSAITALLQRLTLEQDRVERGEPSGLLDVMNAFASELADDIKNGVVVSEARANSRLLGYFNMSEQREAGKRFWQWLENQDERSTSHLTYAAAINLLAADGVPLSNLEALYGVALARIPDNFMSYHLSPTAVVPDRSQALNFKVPSIKLLLAIMSARVVHGDVRNAYLALDTALRLFPEGLDQHGFGIFIQHRPLPEAFTAFALACRCGVRTHNNHLVKIALMSRKNDRAYSPSGYIASLRGLLSLYYLHFTAGGVFRRKMVDELIIFTSRAMRVHSMMQQAGEDRRRIADKVLSIIRNLLELFAQLGAMPSSTSFDAIILNIGGLGGNEEAIGAALADMEALALAPTDWTWRAAMSAAGFLGNGPRVIRNWQALVFSTTEAGKAPSLFDFENLIEAAAKTGQLDYARQQYEGLKEYLGTGSRAKLEAKLAADSESEAAHFSKLFDVDRLLSDLDVVQADVEAFAAAATVGAEAHIPMRQHLPMTILAPGTPKLPESEMRKLYDEMTTSEDAPPEPDQVGDQAASIARNAFNTPYDTLRYQNWKTINYLLEQSSTETLEGGTSSGRPGADRTSGKPRPLFVLKGDVSRSSGISDAQEQGQSNAEQADEVEWSPGHIARGRLAILALRGLA